MGSDRITEVPKLAHLTYAHTLVIKSTFDNQSMSIGCIGKLGHLFGLLRHYLLIGSISNEGHFCHATLNNSCYKLTDFYFLWNLLNLYLNRMPMLGMSVTELPCEKSLDVKVSGGTSRISIQKNLSSIKVSEHGAR